MLNRSSIITLAAMAALGSTALMSTSAYASHPLNQYRVATVNTGSNVGTAKISASSVSKITPILGTGNNSGNGGGNGVKTPYKFGVKLYSPNSKPIDIDCVTFKGCGHDHDHDHDHHYPWWADWHRPHVGVVEYDTVPVSAPVTGTITTTPAAAPCNCLTKRYLDDGSVLFTDLCTKEQAMATPDELRAQAQNLTR